MDFIPKTLWVLKFSHKKYAMPTIIPTRFIYSPPLTTSLSLSLHIIDIKPEIFIQSSFANPHQHTIQLNYSTTAVLTHLFQLLQYIKLFTMTLIVAVIAITFLRSTL